MIVKSQQNKIELLVTRSDPLQSLQVVTKDVIEETLKSGRVELVRHLANISGTLVCAVAGGQEKK